MKIIIKNYFSVIRETLPPTLEDEGNTYEKIRHRITRLLKSPRAQEVNKNVRKLILYNFKILKFSYEFFCGFSKFYFRGN